jgi:hypothetical protein
MQNRNRWMVMILMMAGLLLAACAKAPEAPASEDRPAKVEHLEGANPTSVVLTEEAARRLDIQTAPVREEQVSGAQRRVVPYAAVLYDAQGDTWVYTSPEPLTFVRNPIVVDHIDGDTAILSDGPPSGMAVVTVGATELFGSESEFEEE